ncbi:MAG TPA: SpoIIE family protein phosphatase [Streptosporangiaceae bacterium]|nr:SpoIIE family protein phosphatase [Streptosporangiaceae bacterium]
MSYETRADGLHADLADLARRREALRQAAVMPGADTRALLEAAFAELDAAGDALTKLAEADTPPSAATSPPESANAERAMLRAVFQHAPTPLFVLELDGTVRRANARAGELIGAAPGYATGRALTAFVDLSSRAAVESQLAAAARKGTARQVECRLLGPDGPVDTTLTVSVVTIYEGMRLLTVTASGVAGSGPALVASPADGDPGTAGSVVRAMTRRMDMVTAVTRLLLDNSTFSEAVTLQRCARLLAGDIASWVIVDVERADLLMRHLVIGPRDEPSEELARKVRTVDPPAGSVPEHVHSVGTPVLMADVEDTGILGAAPDGTPLLVLIGATSLLSVPITDGEISYGALTLARRPGEGRFELADLGLAEELGRHLGVAIRVDRMFRQRSVVAEALQGSLLPTRMPDVPGLELASAYLPAGEGLEVGGDFFDVFPVPDGWGISVGDVCGKGQEAAAMTAAARHAIRVLARWNPDPADVLARVNEVMLTDGYGERFVTAKLAYLRWDGVRLRVRLAGAGHPGPALVRPDGRVDLLGGGGLPLGLFADAEPEADSLELGEDDLLFFYTDGVTDARTADLHYFDEDLGETLAGLAGRSAAHTARTVQDLVSGFGQDDLRDDVTILVAKVTSPPRR